MGGFSLGFSAGFDVEEEEQEEPETPPTVPHKIVGTHLWADAPHRPHRRA